MRALTLLCTSRSCGSTGETKGEPPSWGTEKNLKVFRSTSDDKHNLWICVRQINYVSNHNKLSSYNQMYVVELVSVDSASTD